MLRWYQKQAVEAVWDYLRSTKEGAPCVVLPTGSGKTFVIAELCRQVVEWGGRALVLAHVKELLEQTAEKLAAMVDGNTVGLYSAGLGERTTSTPIVVAGIQSVYTRAEELGEFQLLVVDEAHLIPPTGSGRYRTLLNAEKTVSPKARLVGLTATPYRMGCGWIVKDRADSQDESGYDRILDTVVYDAPTSQLIADGTLSRVASRAAKRAPDFSGVHTVRGDFDENEVEKILSGRNVLESVCGEIIEKTADRHKVVVFCNRVESARKVAKILQEHDPNFAAEVVDGETASGDRADIVRRFKSDVGDTDLFGNESKPLKYVCNVGVFTTGFDAPNVDCVALLRPTKSLALYQQMIGRGLRRAPNKADCLVLDFGGNIDRHGPIDLPVPVASYTETDKNWKTCQACGGVVAKYFQICPLCGAAFSVARREVDANSGITRTSSASAILSADGEPAEPIVEEYQITEVEYEAHYKKNAPPDAVPTFQVKYLRGQFSRPIFEWLCPEHSGWIRKKFEKWWKSKSKTDPPESVETCVQFANSGALATPTKIRTTLKPGEKFPTVEWVEFTEIPDFDESNVIDDTDEFLSDFSAYEEEPPLRTCQSCRYWSPDDQLDSLGYCSRYGTEKPPEGAGPNTSCYEQPWPAEDLPF